MTGEGALLALGGSAVGTATDLGTQHAGWYGDNNLTRYLSVGSSRIPAAFSGLAALKTSEGRLSITGIATMVGPCGSSWQISHWTLRLT
jgi:amidase